MNENNEIESVDAVLAQQVYSHMINDNPDSLEIGTPAKGGVIKVYGSFSRLEEFKAKIDEAMKARKYAQSLMDAPQGTQ
jgi:hypothetical protein